MDDVRKHALAMQTDIKDLLKNEWAETLKSLDSEKIKAESDKKANIAKAKAKNDSKAIQEIEKQHQAKMVGLNSQVLKLQKEKNQKEEAVAKQIAMQEARIKALEADVER